MRPLRNLANELVERRLWPVALLLLVALAAVPLLLAKPASSIEDDAPATPAPAQAQAAAAAARAPSDVPPGGEPVVAIAQADQPAAPLRGQRKNPFRQQHLAAEPVTTSSQTASAAGSSGTSAGGTGSSGNPGSGGGSGGDAAPQPTYVYASIDVRFGHAGRRLRSIEDVPRLTPLPNANNPVVIFLGMRRDRETAVFLVSTDVHVQGLGQCVPGPRDCQAIELREGEAAFLDFTEADGSVQQYELDLDAVTLHETTSEAVASRAYARVSRAGKLLLGRGSVRSSLDGERPERRLPFRYVEQTGVLHIAPWASRSARAARRQGSASGARLADLPPVAP